MLLYSGYNVITAGHQAAFHKACDEQLGVAPAQMSIVEFLRLTRQRLRFPAECVEIQGMIDLWKEQPDDEVAQMQQTMRQVLKDGQNWLEDAAYVICFVLPEGIELMPGDNSRLSVRLFGGRYIPLHDIFGRPIRISDDHYRWAFSIDS